MAKPDLVPGYVSLGPEYRVDSALIVCPTCGRTGWIDGDQYRGEVSIDCPECDYHETHDLRDTDHE